MTQNRIIGLIGGSGTGKSTFCTVAADMGYKIIDGDKIGHTVLQEEAYDELVSAFDGITDETGKISRKKLAAIVFSDERELNRLNSIVHKHIVEKITSMLSEKCVIDAAVLHKTPLIKKCTHIIAVSASYENRIARIVARDGITEAEARQRLDAQDSDEYYRSLADIVLCNDGGNDEFTKTVRECLGNL